jgi:Arc/MetJ-type ribon-helix-helix transcriptional regulator
MPTIQVLLPESLEPFVASQVAVEGHSSASEYLLSLLRQAQQAKAKAELEAKLLAGLEALDRGDGRPMTSADWERLRSGVRERYGTEERR